MPEPPLDQPAENEDLTPEGAETASEVEAVADAPAPADASTREDVADELADGSPPSAGDDVGEEPASSDADISQADLDALVASMPPDETAESATSAAPAQAGATPFELPDFGAAASEDAEAHPIDLLDDVNLRVEIELGRTRMYVEDVLKLSKGSVVELDKLAGDPVDVLINGRLIAHGEVLVLNDNFCVRINEIVNGVDAPTFA